MAQDANTPSQVNTTERIEARSSQILGEPPDQLLFGSIQEDFTWLKFGELIWARTEEFKAAIFWAVTGAEPVHLNGDDALQALSNLLLVHTGPLPDGLTPIQLAGAIRQLTVEPRACVASREFYQEVLPDLADWLVKDTKQERDRFAAQCSDPELTRSTEDETWTLVFNVFNPEGGVERWTVAGDKARIQSATRSLGVRNGTFVWPMA